MTSVAEKIVCGVDDSEAARAAVSIASSLAALLARRLVLLHVAEQRRGAAVAAGPPADPDEFEDGARRDAREHLLERLMHELGLAASVAERRVEVGDPSSVLLKVAEAEAAELIVVGTRGRGRLAAALLGSVRQPQSHARALRRPRRASAGATRVWTGRLCRRRQPGRGGGGARCAASERPAGEGFGSRACGGERAGSQRVSRARWAGRACEKRAPASGAAPRGAGVRARLRDRRGAAGRARELGGGDRSTRL